MRKLIIFILVVLLALLFVLGGILVLSYGSSENAKFNSKISIESSGLNPVKQIEKKIYEDYVDFGESECKG